MPANEAMNAAQVIANYELLAALTAQMHAAAEQGGWDQLINLETQRTALLTDMKSMDAAVALDAEAQRRKIQLIEKILADDARTRHHTKIQMSQLELNMQSEHNAQRVNKAYGI